MDKEHETLAIFIMSPESPVVEALETLQTFLAGLETERGAKLTAVLLKIANFSTQEDLDYFKEGQGWTLANYEDAVARLKAAWHALGWQFEDNVVTKQMFLDWVKFYGPSSSAINDRTDFLVQALRGESRGGAGKIHGLSPLVVQTSFHPLPHDASAIPVPAFTTLFTS